MIRTVYASAALDKNNNLVVVRVEVSEPWVMPDMEVEYQENKAACAQGLQGVVEVLHFCCEQSADTCEGKMSDGVQGQMPCYESGCQSNLGTMLKVERHTGDPAPGGHLDSLTHSPARNPGKTKNRVSSDESRGPKGLALQTSPQTPQALHRAEPVRPPIPATSSARMVASPRTNPPESRTVFITERRMTDMTLWVAISTSLQRRSGTP